MRSSSGLVMSGHLYKYKRWFCIEVMLLCSLKGVSSVIFLSFVEAGVDVCVCVCVCV